MNPDVATLVDGMRRALEGGPPVVPLPLLSAQAPPSGTALVVRTSGSTGTPREVALSSEALRASAAATRERLGAAGRWVLTLPATHVAGMQVLVRSILAGTPLTAADPAERFTPDGLASLLAGPLAGDEPVFVSLVPTQLHRVVAAADDGAPAGLRALARCGAVLLGGAATPPGLLDRTRAAGVPVVRTYGMSETAGGCVYDGVPLPGVRVRLSPAELSGSAQGMQRAEPDSSSGVVEIAGPTLATCYLGDDDATAAAFRAGPDGPWLRTSDLGSLTDGVLQVLGRADDAVVTGGENVAPAAVEAVLGELLDAEVCVVGVPDDEWGQVVVAVVAGPHPELSGSALGIQRARPDNAWGALDDDELAQVRAVVTDRLGRAAAPRHVLTVPALPLRGPGKVDRAAVVDLVRRAGAQH